MAQEEDAGYKKLFSAPELVRDLILGFIPDEWLHGLDYSTLEKQPASYVTDDYRHRADDVVWRVKVDGEWVWIRAVLLRKTKSTLALPKVDNLKELKMTLAERFEEWAKAHEQRGMEKGREEGIGKGEALLLQRLLVRRFGALPPEVTEQIAGAGVEQIEAWGDRVLEATTLDEIFKRKS